MTAAGFSFVDSIRRSPMILWFAILAPVIVAEVFRSPMVDYRVVALGALLPLVELALGGPNVLHTLLGAVGLLAVVMAVTPNRRLVRRRLLGLPIGLLLHLVLDGSWTTAALFWWPAFGTGFGSDQIPEFDRPLGVMIVLEFVAIAVGWWAFRRYELGDAENRKRLLSTGQLTRGVL